MSNTATPPPGPGVGGRPVYIRPQCPRSLAGPIVLIIIGVLFLLKNLGLPISVFEVFAKWWPLLLVLAGAIRLAEYYVAQREGTPTPRIGGGMVFLLIMLMIAGGASNALYRNRDQVNWGEVRDHVQMDDDFMHLFGSTYNFDGEVSQTANGATSLKVLNDRGNVTISSSDDPNIKVIWHKRLFASNEQESNNINSSTMPQFSVASNMVTLNTNTQGAGPKGVATDVEIVMPKKMSVDIATKRGDVNITGREGEVHLDLGRGDLSVDDINGNVVASMRRGSLRASKVTGGVSADGRMDDISLSEISGGVRLTGDFFGDTRLSKIAKGVKFNSSRTDLEFTKLDGDLDMDRGNLRANQLAGPLLLSTRAKDIELLGVTGDVKLNNDAGDVTVQTSQVLPVGSIEINIRRGDVKVQLPAKAAFEVSANTRHGDVTTDFSDVKIDNPEHGGASASGKVAKGGPRMTLSSDSGDIAVNKLTQEAAGKE